MDKVSALGWRHVHPAEPALDTLFPSADHARWVELRPEWTASLGAWGRLLFRDRLSGGLIQMREQVCVEAVRRHDVACCPQSDHFDTEYCSSIDIDSPGCPRCREEVMTDANLFQEFAQEALQRASKAKSEQEKLALNELALAWVNAALASDRVFGSSWYFPRSSLPH